MPSVNGTIVRPMKNRTRLRTGRRPVAILTHAGIGALYPGKAERPMCATSLDLSRQAQTLLESPKLAPVAESRLSPRSACAMYKVPKVSGGPAGQLRRHLRRIPFVRPAFKYFRRLIRPARLGTLRRTTPLSTVWGADRGTPLDRFYIEGFLEEHLSDIRGRRHNSKKPRF